MIAFDLGYELTLGVACAALDRRRAGLIITAAVYVPFCAAGLALWPHWQTMIPVAAPQPVLQLAQAALLFGAFALGTVTRRALLVPAWIAALAAMIACSDATWLDRQLWLFLAVSTAANAAALAALGFSRSASAR